MPETPPQNGTAQSFVAGSYTNGHGTRDYKLKIPSGYRGQPLPLIVMLHGCTQDPDDFAAGTRMNEIAEQYDCFVVYPSQPQAANPSRCWNWFEPQHQQRDAGEPSLIAGITRQVMKTHRIDPRQVFIAGMSAGGAMAVIMAATYPELYAAAGVHSGLPYRAAKNVFAALTAMRGGAASAAAAAKRDTSIPIIVFHGDEDSTVHPRNGEQIVSRSLATAEADDAAHAADSAGPAAPSVRDCAESAGDSSGRSYARTVHRDAAGNAVAEHWVVHGAGHAWAGGSQTGSFTDPQGPDASREMVRFFLRQPRQPRQAVPSSEADGHFGLTSAAGLGSKSTRRRAVR
jgi:poly(hydroxyalkanoate) depolymerase family esterase